MTKRLLFNLIAFVSVILPIHANVFTDPVFPINTDQMSSQPVWIESSPGASFLQSGASSYDEVRKAEAAEQAMLANNDGALISVNEPVTMPTANPFAQATKRELTAKASKTIKRAATKALRSTADPSGQYFADNFSALNGKTGYTMLTFTNGTDGLGVSGIYNQDTVLRATFDASKSTVLIPAQKIARTARYGEIWIMPIKWDEQGHGTVSRSGNIEGTIFDDGIIELGGWGVFVYEGPDAGGVFDYYTGSILSPANSTITITNHENKTATLPSRVEQTNDNTLVIYNFGGCNTPVKARLNLDNTIDVSPQYMMTNSVYGDIYCYWFDVDSRKTNLTAPIQATYNNNGEITVGGYALLCINNTTLSAGYYRGAKIATQVVPEFPKSSDIKFDGDGSEASPFLLKSAKDMFTFSQAINGGLTYRGQFFRLANDIDMAGQSQLYTTAGGELRRFAGTLDGNGKSISNLTVDALGFSYQGLIGMIDTVGCIKNLTLKNFAMTSYGKRTGTIAGENRGTITNCAVEGTINAYNEITGGIAAYNSGVIDNCSYKGKFNVAEYAGGISGFNIGFITNCTVKADMTTTTVIATVHSLGGICGSHYAGSRQNATIADCVFAGNITDKLGYAKIGGIAGYVTGGIITRCLSMANISTTNYANNASADDYRAQSSTDVIPDNGSGGIAGVITNGVGDKGAEIYDCMFAGTLVKSKISNRAGGLIGYYSSSYSNGVLYGPSHVYNCINVSYIQSQPKDERDQRGIVGQAWTQYNQDPVGQCFTNCYSDNQMTGLYDTRFGVDGKTLTSGTLPTGFDPTIWKAEAGRYPIPAKFADMPEAQIATAWISMPNGESTSKFKGPGELSAASDIRMLVYDPASDKYTTSTSGLTVSGNKITTGLTYDMAMVLITNSTGSHGKMAIISTVPHIYSGTGSENDPYLLKSAGDFVELNNGLTRCGQSHRGDYFKVAADIDFAQRKDFAGFGAKTNAIVFSGTFDGDGHMLHNLHVKSDYTDVGGNPAEGSYTYAGLFHMISKYGTVKNVNIAADCTVDAYNFGGAIAGYNEGVIDNCRNYADINVIAGGAGGIVGGNYIGGTVKNCYNSGNVTSGANTGGGIAGYNLGSITISQNDGNVTAHQFTTKEEHGTLTQFGGVAGLNNGGDIDRCVNTGAVTARGLVGGIAGYSQTEAPYGVHGCVNHGLVTCTSGMTSIGGLIGQVVASREGKIENNYYDSQIVPEGAVNALNFNGIEGLTTTKLTSGKALSGLNADEYSLAAGKYPVLSKFAAEAKALTNRSIYVLWDEADNRNDMRSDATLSAAEGLVWKLACDTAFHISGNKLSVENKTIGAINDTLYAVQNGTTVKTIPVSNVPVLFDGQGTEQSPYLLRTTDDLLTLRTSIADYGKEYENCYFKLANDITYEGDKRFEFLPLTQPNGTSHFKGILDGDGHTISGYEYFAPDKTNLGFCPSLGSGGVIRNLTLDGTVSGAMYTGGFVGKCYGTIENCVFKGAVTSVTSYAAGFAAEMFDGSVVRNCRNEGEVGLLVTGPNAPTLTGGIAGKMGTGTLVEGCVNTRNVGSRSSRGGIASKSAGTIRECSNTADLTNGTASTVGGIVSATEKGAVIENCTNSGNIENPGYGTMGGIAGSVGGIGTIVRNCHNTGAITGKNYIGGVAGSTSNGVIISDCSNTAIITAAGGAGCGGAIGNMAGSASNPSSVKRCFNTGNITSDFGSVGGIAGACSEYAYIDSCYNIGDIVSGNTASKIQIGGIAGQSNGRLSNCFNAGNVSGDSYGVGGIAGAITKVTAYINDCVNFGNVTSTKGIGNTGEAKKVRYGNAGGIVGYSAVAASKTDTIVIARCGNFGEVTAPDMAAGIMAAAYKGTKLTDCFNTGTVTGTNSGASRINATFGFYEGTSAASVATAENVIASNLYYDSTVQPTAGANDSRFTALTTNEMLALELPGYTNLESCYPIASGMAQEAHVQLHAASVSLANGDDFNNVNNAFKVGMPGLVTWTSSSNLSIAPDGTVTPIATGTAWVRASVKYGDTDVYRMITLNVNGTSSIDGLETGKTIDSQIYIDMAGRVVATPVAGQIYVVRTTYTDGTSKTAKIVYGE